MKKLFLLCLLGLTFGCTSTNPALTPIQQAGCYIETAITGGAAGAVASALTCTNQAAIQASLNTALGNANLCATPVPPAAPATPATQSKVAPKWQTIGDITKDDVAAAGQVQSKAVVAKGVIGNIACPLAINTIVGFLSNSVPSAWGCSQSSSMASLVTALTSACELAVPI